MEDSGGSTGVWATAAAAVSAFLVAGVAAYRELRRDKSESKETANADKVRAHLDEHQRRYLDRLEADVDRERTMREVWELRARRVDTLAHDMRDQWTAERQAAGNMTPLPRIPLLEDPLEATHTPPWPNALRLH